MEVSTVKSMEFEDKSALEASDALPSARPDH
jgi:hypothetical protein